MQGLEAQAARRAVEFFLTGARGPDLTNLDYAPIKEIMGRVLWAPEVFNCSAPDVGNMELLSQYANEEQKRQWLAPLLAGEIRSRVLDDRAEVANGDATNIRCRIGAMAIHYVINGLPVVPRAR